MCVCWRFAFGQSRSFSQWGIQGHYSDQMTVQRLNYRLEMASYVTSVHLHLPFGDPHFTSSVKGKLARQANQYTSLQLLCQRTLEKISISRVIYIVEISQLRIPLQQSV